MKLTKVYHQFMRNFHMDMFLSVTDCNLPEYMKHKRKYEYHAKRLFTIMHGQ